jgi:hypothetical protein
MDSQNVIYNNGLITKIIMENNNDFECIVIKKGSIKEIDWFIPDYLNKILDLDLIDIVNTNQDNFIKFICTNLQIDKYTGFSMNVKKEIITDEPNYLYELLYIDLEKEIPYHIPENLNELANLININDDIIYSNAILLKTYIPTLTDSISLCSINKEDVKRFLSDRLNTKIITWNDEWNELPVAGDLNIYANVFFDEPYHKFELGFLMHNINIWYTTIDLPFNKHKSICGNLLHKSIDKCIWFTMKSEEYRGNLSLDEVKKIIYLSNKLTNYETPSEYLVDKTDTLGRKIIYNKYKVLDLLYNKMSL